MSKTLNQSLCFAFGFLALSMQAIAADSPTSATAKPEARQFGSGKPKGRLDRNALRQCLRDQERIKGLTDAYIVDSKDADSKKANIQTAEKALQEKSAVLDRTKLDEVDAYNAQVKQRDQLIDEYNAATPALNAKAEALQSQRAAWAQACGDRTYDELDYFAIQREGKKK